MNIHLLCFVGKYYPDLFQVLFLENGKNLLTMELPILPSPIMPKESSSEKQAKTIKVKLNNIGVAATT